MKIELTSSHCSIKSYSHITPSVYETYFKTTGGIMKKCIMFLIRCIVDVFTTYQTFVNDQANGRDVFSCYQEYRSHK
jgi:hypothetical protein